MTRRLLPPLLEPAELADALDQPEVLVVDLSAAQRHVRGHIPGSVHLEYARLIAPRPPVMGLLPDDRALQRLLREFGVCPQKHVVAYDDEGGGKAARLLWTLDILGHTRFSLLDGGLHAWANEGHRLDAGAVKPRAGSFNARRQDEGLADTAYLLRHLDDDDVVLLDVRTLEEYRGQQRYAARGGHIPGAIHWEWTSALDTGRNLRLRPAPELRAELMRLGVVAQREVICYCQNHHRSAHTCVVLKLLGFPRVRGYHGSWSEWGNRTDTPIESDARHGTRTAHR